MSFVNTGSYQLIVEGEIGSGWAGDIAIDDIIITPGYCEGIGSCNFEEVSLAFSLHITLKPHYSK